MRETMAEPEQPLEEHAGDGAPPGAAAWLDEVLAVLVLYECPLADSATFQSLDGALARSGGRLELVVYDNSPTPAELPPDVESARWLLRHLHDPSNPGVSRAYREGARIATERGKRWLLFLDQDTRFGEDVLEAYVTAIHAHPAVRLFAPRLRARRANISPCRYQALRGAPLEGIEPGVHRLDSLSVLNSGMCVATEAYSRAGGHDPAIPLDFSDHEFVGRFRRLYPEFALVDTGGEHGLSAAEEQSVENRLRRFDQYCAGARRVTGPATPRPRFVFVVLARAMRLALRHRHPGFLRIFAAHCGVPSARRPAPRE